MINSFTPKQPFFHDLQKTIQLKLNYDGRNVKESIS